MHTGSPIQSLNPQTSSLNIQAPEKKPKKNSHILFIIFGIICLSIGGIFFFSILSNKLSNTSLTKVTPTPMSSGLAEFTDNEKIFTLKYPQNFGSYTSSFYYTDSCTLFSDRAAADPDISASEAAKNVKEGTFIDVCYSAEEFPVNVPEKLSDYLKSYKVLSSEPYSLNSYSGFKASVKSNLDNSVKEMIILKSPFGGYATLTRDANGEKVFSQLLSSFKFISQKTKRFGTADLEIIRNMFADMYKKDITATFGYPSSDQNSVGGQVYIPQGQKCFNADRIGGNWKITYIGTGIHDSKCYEFEPNDSQ